MVGVGAAAGTVVPPAAALAGAGGVSVAAAAILGGFVSWLAQLRAQHQAWLTAELGSYGGQRDDVAEVARQEMVLEQEFAKNAADRLASAMPQALRIKDPDERQAKIRQLLADEERYARQRAEAMVARAIAAVTRSQLRQVSPLGAFWKLGHAQKHTEACKFMAGKFWPWAVLDRVHPPRHYGCTSSLHSYGEAILEGWMRPSDVPDTRDAVRAASGVVMEADEADALLAELDVRDQLLEMGMDVAAIPFAGVSEAFDPVKHPRGYRGEFRVTDAFMAPKEAATALKRGLPAAIAPKDAEQLVDELGDGTASSLHLLQVGDHANLFRSHARALHRSEMPQIPKDNLQGFMKFLRGKRVTAEVETIAPSELQATQDQINGGAVAALAKGWDPQKGGMMLISSERHVLDGHHRWAAAALHQMSNPAYTVQALRFSAGTGRMLELMHEYNDQVGVKARPIESRGVPKVAA